MRTVIVRKSATVYHGMPTTESLTIKAEEEFPECKGILEYENEFLLDAQKIEEALYETLPGGTLDRLLLLLMERKASVLRVAYRQ